MRVRALVMAAAVSAAIGCGDDGGGRSTSAIPTPTATVTPIVDAAELVGVYDSNRGIVLVTGGGRFVHMDFGLVREASITVQGTLGDDGTIALAGTQGLEDTGTAPVSGRVVVARSATEIRIAGTVAGSAFEASRPPTGTPTDLGGRFAFRFEQSLSGRPVAGHVVLAIDVPADGRGRSVSDAAETDDAGTRLGTLSAGVCLASPAGDFECRARYAGAGGHPGPFGGPSEYDAVIGGVLPMPDLGFIGTGGVVVTNQAPITLHAFFYTTWTARADTP